MTLPNLPRRPRSLLLAAIAVLLVHLPTSAQTPADSSGYSLKAGDRVTVKLYTAAGQEVAVVTGERVVDQDGNVFLPYVGTITVAGLDENGLRELLTERYGSFYDEPVLNLTVQLRISITGSVRTPGQYFLNPTTTLIDAIANAGGMTPELVSANQLSLPSDQSKVRLVRDGRTEILNLRPDEVTDENLTLLIRSGDWVHVPPRPRSRIRDEVQFWGSILSFVTSAVFLVILVS